MANLDRDEATRLTSSERQYLHPNSKTLCTCGESSRSFMRTIPNPATLYPLNSSATALRNCHAVLCRHAACNHQAPDALSSKPLHQPVQVPPTHPSRSSPIGGQLTCLPDLGTVPTYHLPAPEQLESLISHDHDQPSTSTCMVPSVPRNLSGHLDRAPYAERPPSLQVPGQVSRNPHFITFEAFIIIKKPITPYHMLVSQTPPNAHHVSSYLSLSSTGPVGPCVRSTPASKLPGTNLLSSDTSSIGPLALEPSMTPWPTWVRPVLNPKLCESSP